MYGSESSSAVEKHILNLHLKPFNPKIASNMNVAEAKRKFPEIVPQLKQLTVKVTPTDASYNQVRIVIYYIANGKAEIYKSDISCSHTEQ